MTEALVLQQPPLAQQLVLLFHGVGATAQDLAPLGRRIAAEFPHAVVASIPAPDASDLGGGRQWFSVRGVTEQNRPARVQETLPRFLATVQDWQRQSGLGAAQTILVGFSQGAIMALASSAAAQPPAARVVSLSGRFDQLPSSAPVGVRFHFIHGEQDPVIPASHAEGAVKRLQELGVPATLDLVPGLAHGIDQRVLAALLASLRE